MHSKHRFKKYMLQPSFFSTKRGKNHPKNHFFLFLLKIVDIWYHYFQQDETSSKM